MQISPTSALLNALSSLPAQAGAVPQGPAATPGPVTPTQPPALAAAAKALAAREASAQAQTPAPAPPAESGAPRNMPRGSVVNIVV
jgi:hypothetical protein